MFCMINMHLGCLFKTHRVINIAVLSLLIVSVILFEHWHKYQRYFLYAVSVCVSAILFVCCICMCISDTFSLIFWQYSIPILLLSGVLVKSANNNITVSKRVKTRTVV